MAFILAMLMFSLIGIPPLAGFFGKFYAFAAAIQAKLYILAVIASWRAWFRPSTTCASSR